MIVLDYKLSPSWNDHSSGTELAFADESTLRYRVFLGDIIFKVDGIDFTAAWGWIPVIDFAASLRYIANEIKRQDACLEIFDFTESNATLEFLRDGDYVSISASYAPGRGRVTLSEFIAAADQFARAIVSDISERYASLLHNRILPNLLPVDSTTRFGH